MAVSGSSGDGWKFLMENNGEIASAVQLASSMIEDFDDVHRKEKDLVDRIDSEIGFDEKIAEKNISKLGKEVEKEGENIGDALKALSKGLYLTEKVIEKVDSEDTVVDKDVEQVQQVVEELKNNPRDADISELVDVIDTIYIYISDEVLAEKKTAGYLFRMASESENLARAETSAEEDLEMLEMETDAEAQVHRDSLLKTIHDREEEFEQTFEQEKQYLSQEFNLERHELEKLQEEIDHTLKEARRLETVLNNLTDLLYGIGYNNPADKVNSVLQKIQDEVQKLEETKNEIQASYDKINQGETEL